MNNRSHVRTSEILLGLFPELVFIVLPLSVVVLVDGLYHHKGMLELLGSPEWAFAAVVLWGQASVKFSSGLPARGRLRLDAVGAVHAAILLLGLGPAFVVLILSLVSAPSPTVGLGQSDWQHDIVHGRQVLASLESRHECGQALYTALSPSLAS